VSRIPLEYVLLDATALKAIVVDHERDGAARGCAAEVKLPKFHGAGHSEHDGRCDAERDVNESADSLPCCLRLASVILQSCLEEVMLFFNWLLTEFDP
jgi:hypothetical protein